MKTKNAKAAMLLMALAAEETNRQVAEESYQITRIADIQRPTAYMADYKHKGERSHQLNKKQKKARAKAVAAKKARKQRRK